MDGEPPQEEDFSTIPLVERSTHKNWKARLSAYNEVIAKAAKTASDTDPFFRPYLDGSLLKSWCLDANAVAQEKGIEAALTIVTNSGETSARLRPEVTPALVEKGVGSTRAGTKKKAVELCAMFVEVENGGEGVVTDVLVGLNAKAPKAVAGTVSCLKELIESFGVPALGNVKPLLKALPKIFGHSDKNVRAEGTALTIVLYTYLGPALLPALADLKPVQMTDLQKSFDAKDAEGQGAGSGKPTRWTRKTQRDREAAADAGEDGDAGVTEEEPEAIDPMSLLDPVNVYKLFPADLMDRLMSSKWKERLESLEECNKVLADPKNARISDSNADEYGPLAQTLGTKCHKDANVNVVMEAAKVLEGLSKGLGKAFGRYRSVTMTGCLERLKERKAAVVEALGKALDAIFLTTTLQDIVEDVLTALKSKNPQVKEGTLNFLHRSLKATLDAPNKDQIKPMAEALVALLSDSAEPVRAAAAECLGTMMKILGERAFNPYIENVPEIQLAKVKDAFARAEIKYKAGGAKKPAARAAAPQAKAAPPKAAPPARTPAKKPAPPQDELLDDFSAPPARAPPARFRKPAAAPAAADDELLDDFAPPAKAPPARFQRPAKAAPPPEDELLADVAPPTRAPPARFQRPGAAKAAPPTNSGPPSPTKAAAARPTTAAKPPPKPSAAAGPSKPAPKAGGGGGAKTLASSPTDPVKYKYTPEEALARAEEMIPANYHTALADSAWKVRLEAGDEMVQWVSEGAAEELDSEVLMRFLCKTPGWGEKNFQVSGKLYQVMQIMAERSPSFGKPAASLIVGPLTDKLGDLKLKKPAGEALTAIAEKTSLAFLLAQSYDSMTKQKAPKAQADALTWIKQQVIDFGIAGIPLREMIAFVKGALGSPNAMVRSSATSLLVQIKIGVGADISGFIEDLNPTLLATINKEFDKVADQTPPEPTRTQADLREVAAAPGKGGKGGADPLDDLIPRVDLDKLVNQTTVINDSRSDAWKVRKEAFESLSALLDIKSNQRLKPNMGEVATVLKKAMGDTNLAVKMLALGIISKIATGMGQPFEKYTRILVQAVASVCADQKATTRGAAINTLTAIAEACGSLDSMYHGLGASLESTNPALRAAVLGFVVDRLGAEPPTASSDLTPLAAPIISCLEDRNGEVRKAATAALPFVIASAGYDTVMDQTSRLKPASKATIVPLINNARAAAAPAVAESGPPIPPKAAPTTPARGPSLKAPTSKAAGPGTPRAAPAAAIPRPGLGAGRSIAMKALSSAPTARPGSSLSEDRPGAPRSRIAQPRSLSSSTSAPPPPPAQSSERTLPFITSDPNARASRLKRDSARWTLDVASRADMLDYLHQQMEGPAPEIVSLLFSKDHRAEEDFMAALSTMAEFYDVETSPSFGLPAAEVEDIQLANVDLTLKYSALKLLSNNTQLANRCLDVIQAVLDTLSRLGERLSEVEVRLFVPALVMKLGDAKFGIRLAGIFEGLDKLIPASQVVQLLSQYGIEDKTSGKTCKNESLQLIEKAYRKRGSVIRKDDRAFYEAVAKCIADQGTRQNALTLMALLQMQGESRNLQAVIATMPTSSKDMLANRRATMAASQGGVGRAASAADMEIARSQSPRPGARGIPTPGARLSREMGSSAPTSPGPQSRPASRGTPSRLSAAAGTPTRGIPAPRTSASATAIPAPGGRRSIQPPSRVSALPSADGPNGVGIRPSMQPLSRHARPAPVMSEAAMVIEGIRSSDIEESTDCLKTAASMIEEDDREMIAEARSLLNALTYQLEAVPPNADDFMDPAKFRRIKHLMRCVHIAFGKPMIVDKLALEPVERCFAGTRVYFALLEVNAENEGPKSGQSQTDELRDYISMVLSAIITTPSRELVFTMLFHSLVELCRPQSHDKRLSSEIGVVLQCTYKRVRSVDSDLRNNKISAGVLLAVIEELLQQIPPMEWRRRPKLGLPHGDLPLRVVKTLLQRVIVYTKEINIGIYDLLQDQFGADADMTTVYSYIFRISSGHDDGPGSGAKAAPSQGTMAPPPAPPPAAPSSDGDAIRRRSNGHGSERPVSRASSARMSVIDMPATVKSPPREVSEAVRLVRSLTDARDSEQRLNELYAFMKSSPENEAEARAAISTTLNPAAQTFVWRALDRRSGDAEPRSPAATSPVRSLLPEIGTPPLGSIPKLPSARDRPQSMVDDATQVNDKYAALTAIFRNRPRTSTGSGGAGASASSSSRSSPSRPLSDIEREKSPTFTAPGRVQRPRSDIPQSMRDQIAGELGEFGQLGGLGEVREQQP